MNSDPAKQAWQASVEIAGAPPLDEVRAGAGKFYRAIRLRNSIEYVACVVVVVSFGSYVFTLPYALQKLGSAMIVVATFYVAWQLHRRASAETPEKAGAMPIYVFLRAQLVRQRDALKGIFWWYIAPFLPGFVAIVLGSARERAAEGEEGIIRGLIGAAVAILLVIWWLNQLGARKLQKHIDEIDALTEGPDEAHC